MYSIPLRRALVTTSDLPYPEGVACAEVLKVGSSGDSEHASDIEHGRAGLLAVLWGSIVSAVFAVVVATQMFASDVAQTFRIGRRGAVSGYDFSLSFALLAIGHLVGLSVGIAMLIGTLIGWGWGVPHYSALASDVTTAAAGLAQSTWSHKVRFLGAGAIGVSAIWTLLKLVKPVASGLAGAMAASRARKAGKADTLPITERDIPIGIVGIVTLVCMLPIGWLLGYPALRVQHHYLAFVTLAFNTLVLHGGQNVIFAVFGCFALLVMSDFGGQRPARALVYLTATSVGALLVTIGTLASGSTILATAVTFVVGFVIAFSRVFGGYVAAAQTGMLLSFVIAVSIPAPASAIPALAAST